MLNGHGDDLHLIKGKIKYNFSSNVYYQGAPKTLLTHILESVPLIQNYPSPTAHELNKLAAKKFGLTSENFLFTNGATEAFYLIAQFFANKKAAILAPTFAEYEDACKIFNLDYQLISITEIKDVTTDVIFICSPNNPTGTTLATNQLETLVELKPETTFVIDEAYIEFTENTTSLLSLTIKYSNLIVVRSLTKTFTIPGLRLGYMVSHPKITRQITALKMPWSVNALAIKAGEFIFNNYESLQFDASKLLKETAIFKNELSKLKGLKIHPSTTSYFLVQLVHKSARELKEYLIDNHQILIRDATNFKKLDGEYIRLSTQDKKANSMLIKALKEWI
ncbi:pyridoxal phosphate-dependent aminotransferase [Aquimarina sp. W85]|uniref:pyridoxal phosphate-dependent aminotransferase n=1 Tax=Aquimarina rhodophyticola TaxID=3342246 RepID=UPI00366ACE31